MVEPRLEVSPAARKVAHLQTGLVSQCPAGDWGAAADSCHLQELGLGWAAPELLRPDHTWIQWDLQAPDAGCSQVDSGGRQPCSCCSDKGEFHKS